MDVNLGPGRTGRIGIHEGDDPKMLAKNFAASYHLDEFLTKRLEELIRENVTSNPALQGNGEIVQQTPSNGTAIRTQKITENGKQRSKTPGPEREKSSAKVQPKRSSSAKRPQHSSSSLSDNITKTPPKQIEPIKSKIVTKSLQNNHSQSDNHQNNDDDIEITMVEDDGNDLVLHQKRSNIPVLNGQRYQPHQTLRTVQCGNQTIESNYQRAEMSTQTLSSEVMSILSNSPMQKGILDSLRELKNFTESDHLI